MNDAIGLKQGTKHAMPDIARDLRELQCSLAEAQVYEIKPGRTIDGDSDAVVPNIVSAGLSQLVAPLAEYNNMFSLLKKRRQRTSPLVGHSTAMTSTLTPAAETGPTVSESQSSAHVAVERSELEWL